MEGEKKNISTRLFIYFFAQCRSRLFAFVGSICRSVGQMIDYQGISPLRTHHARLSVTFSLSRPILLKRQPSPHYLLCPTIMHLRSSSRWSEKLSDTRTDLPTIYYTNVWMETDEIYDEYSLVINLGSFLWTSVIKILRTSENALTYTSLISILYIPTVRQKSRSFSTVSSSEWVERSENKDGGEGWKIETYKIYPSRRV